MTSLNLKQQQALNQLMEQMSVPASRLMLHAERSHATAPDLLKFWLGLSSSDLKTTLAALLNKKNGLEQQWRARVEHNPLDAACEFIAAAALAFYLSEKDANPKIATYIDAFYYIATCASVGYADIFAVTQTGRAIAGFVMIVGPALAAKALDRPTRSTVS